MNTVNVQTAAIAGQNDYLTILETAWQSHLAPKADNAPTVISTFAGGGGSSLGYSMAGYRELLAVEWDNNAVETFKLNFPDVPVYHGDIAKLSVDECLRMAGIAPGELDIFDGSPPCQGFSTAGRRILDDSRNHLFREYVRLLRGLQPKVFVMENVSGMVKGKMKLVFAEILRELKASGYQVRAALLNAMYFHVPQSRTRLIFIGVRDDLGIAPSFPAPENKIITVRKALVDLTVEVTEDMLLQDNRLTRLFDRIKPGQAATHVLGTSSHFTSMQKISPDKPMFCIRKTVTNRGPASITHWKEKRLLSISELKRFAAYPDNYQMTGSFQEQWARIGNSVPPLFMRAIAQHIRFHVLST